MSFNSPKIRITVDLERALYLRLRDRTLESARAGKRKTHSDIVRKALETELKAKATAKEKPAP